MFNLKKVSFRKSSTLNTRSSQCAVLVAPVTRPVPHLGRSLVQHGWAHPDAVYGQARADLHPRGEVVGLVVESAASTATEVPTLDVPSGLRAH